MKVLYIILIILAGLVFIGWLGLQFKPAPFAPYDAQAPEFKTIPLPENLPAPVERYYRAVYGEDIPVIESVVFQGRATIRPFMNIPLPRALCLCPQRREGVPSLHRSELVRAAASQSQ